tara:strand:- start:4433 stop:4639 length:207 start_codon:yes stop_codon:yes gene_type:complete
MTSTETKVKEWGNSLGIIIPKELVDHVGLGKGDKVKIDIIKSDSLDGFGICKKASSFEEEKESHEDLW